jgi:hypothetical protein
VKRELLFSAFWAIAFSGYGVLFLLRANEFRRVDVLLYFWTNLLGASVAWGFAAFFAWTTVSLLRGGKP